jgi:hypothetical protein
MNEQFLKARKTAPAALVIAAVLSLGPPPRVGQFAGPAIGSDPDCAEVAELAHLTSRPAWGQRRGWCTSLARRWERGCLGRLEVSGSGRSG